MRDIITGRFTAGPYDTVPVGTVRIRTRHRPRGVERAWVKVAEPNVWELRARFVWSTTHGPIPPSAGVHHRDGDTLNDALENLEVVSKAEHLSIHRPEFQAKATAGFIVARRTMRWSTKSATKRTGRPPSWTEEQMTRAIQTVSGGATCVEAAAETGVPVITLRRKIRRLRAVG